MKKSILLLLTLSCLTSNFAQDRIVYTLTHVPDSHQVEITLDLGSINPKDAKLVIPRSAPGTYDITNYLAFVDKVMGFNRNGGKVTGIVGDGSFFTFDEKDGPIQKVSYTVDLKKMETDLLGAYASSKSRENYVGMLGYSIFGFIEGLEDKPLLLKIETADNWPIFSTLRPAVDRKFGGDSYEVDSFALLADAQYLLGSSVQVHQVVGAKIPLFVAAYSETPIDIEEIGRRGLMALHGLSDYFGYIPMPHYTMVYEFLEPISDRHDYGFNMEHLNSMSSSNPVSRAITSYDENARIGSIVHHIGHSWIPLRSYGTGYRPFQWQIAPLTETIWLNEGFTWYISYYNVLQDPSILDFFQKTIDNAPDYIKKKSLKNLSLLGSTQYGMDFRIGKNLFSRGALFAHDLDVHIQQKTANKKSFKDAMLGLLQWTKTHQRPFQYNEIEPIMSKSTGVDLSAIWKKWQGPTF